MVSKAVPVALVNVARAQKIIGPSTAVLTGVGTSFTVVGNRGESGNIEPMVLACTVGPSPAPGMPPNKAVLSLYDVQQFEEMLAGCQKLLDELKGSMQGGQP